MSNPKTEKKMVNQEIDEDDYPTPSQADSITSEIFDHPITSLPTNSSTDLSCKKNKTKFGYNLEDVSEKRNSYRFKD